MLKLTDLALRPDFQLGPMLVSPPRRLVEGPGGYVHVEPLIMQVFLLLLDGAGRVVTRNELFDQCWGGVYVGDDSLNRAIAKVRRIGAQVAPGFFEIETIPRTGYRLTGEILKHFNGGADREATDSARASRMTRRQLAGGAIGVLALAGAATSWALRDRREEQFEALMARGDEAFRTGAAFDNAVLESNNSPTMIQLYEDAVRVRPDSARAWGLLAYFKSAAAEDLAGKDADKFVVEAQAAVRRALALDPKEPNARAGLFLLQGSMFDQATRDRILRDILKTDPGNLLAMAELMPLVQSAGLTRESWMWNERILRASPFAHTFLTVRALKLWLLGRIRESDNVIDRVRALWPKEPFAIYARFIMFALTGRPAAARAMMDSIKGLEDPNWRIALDALESPIPAAVEAARDACLKAARASPLAANDMVMVLCALGLKDAAFEVTDGFLLWRGRIVSENQANGRQIDDYARRMTQWLFTPPCKLMRDDPRFLQLCDGLGLTAYWRARHVRPDYQVYG